MTSVHHKMGHTNSGLFYSGTSGLVLPVPNKLSYPLEFQDKSRLTYYASLFNSIEINSSFYKVPQAATVRKWAESVPVDFRFTFKLWRDITHTKGLAFKPEDVVRFMETIDEVGDKKGCLLVQFPPSLKMGSARQLEKLLTCIIQTDPKRQWKIAVESRNMTWYTEEIDDLLEQHHVCLVIHDKPKSATPLQEITTEFVYVRFHGPAGDYKGTYTSDFLHDYAERIQDWKNEGKVVFAYFNNTMGEAVRNLMDLNEDAL